MTISDALTSVQQRSVSYRDAEVLLGHVLGVTRAYLHAHPEQRLTGEQRRQFSAFLKRREKNEPVAYITGSKEFYGRLFNCDHRALIPRPETEGLIDQALSYLPNRFKTLVAEHNTPCPLRVLELGTGCGNIAVTLALELSALGLPASLTATDVSTEALALAAENWSRLGAGSSRHVRLTFLQADLFNHPTISKQAPYDLIVANLPYVEDTWAGHPAAQTDVVFFEPDIALFGGNDGLILYEKFFTQAPALLSPNGSCIVEHGESQGKALRALAATAFPRAKITTHQDYADLDRVTVIQAGAQA